MIGYLNDTLVSYTNLEYNSILENTIPHMIGAIHNHYSKKFYGSDDDEDIECTNPEHTNFNT